MTDRALITYVDEDSAQDLHAYEATAEQRAAQKLASITEDISATSPSADSIHIRDALLDIDLDEFTGGAGVSLYADYTTPTYVLNDTATAGQENSLFQFDNSANFDNKAGVLYGFQFPEPNSANSCQLTEVTITTPNATIGTFDLSGIDLSDRNTVVFENPLIVGKEDRRIEAFTDEQPTAGTSFRPLIKVAEPAGETVSQSGSYADSGV